MDIFRVFDAFNSIDQMRPAIEAVIEAGAVAEGTICYSGNLSSPDEDLYTLDYYLSVAEQLDAAGVHILCIKDMAGLLRPPAAEVLVSALRDRFAQPVHLHDHPDTGGGQLATYLAAVDAGVDAIDGAAPPLSGMTSQPSIASIVAMTDHTDRATGLSLDAIGDMEPYWEAVRHVYAPFEAGLPSPTGTVYRHEIPGGQLSNLRSQARALGLGHRFEEVERLYAACSDLLGRPIKVTPSSKVVGDLALHLVASDVSPEELAGNPAGADLPDSVIGFLHGELGTPAGRLPRALSHPRHRGPRLGAEDQGPHRRRRGGLGGRSRHHAEPAAVPHALSGSRREHPPLRRPVGAAVAAVLVRAGLSRRRHRRSARPGRAAAAGPAVHRRAE